MNSSPLWRLISHSQRNHLVALHSHFFFSTKPKAPKRQQQQTEIAQDSTTTTKPNSGFPRPTEIPFQSKVSNSVNLTGYVRSQVQFQTNSDGSSSAATVITQDFSSKDDGDNDDCEDDHDSSASLPLWVPVIFEGDLAHIVASHIKENDRVHVSGKLSSSLPHVNGSQVSVQVLACDIYFIEKKRNQIQTESPSVTIQSKNVISILSNSTRKDNEPISIVWRDVIDNPNEWFDYRDGKKDRMLSPRHPDFKRKDGSQALWLDRPMKALLKELRGLEFDVEIQKPEEATKSKDSWEDLVNNTKEWRDYRNSKVNGQVNPKHPDFIRKDRTGQALWLNCAPKWFLSKLEGLEFDDDVQVQNSKEVNDSKGADKLWKDLMENPDQWWDNRVGKTNPRAPDFKHKSTGEVLWLSGSPTWALSKLPAPKSMKNTTEWKRHKNWCYFH